ncbi:MAG: hypothetical protein HY965_09385 [Ignavibacteriales bacterium]|nr:hypothetical protein [Ignavibacteriales bacterium]
MAEQELVLCGFMQLKTTQLNDLPECFLQAGAHGRNRAGGEATTYCCEMTYNKLMLHCMIRVHYFRKTIPASALLVTRSIEYWQVTCTIFVYRKYLYLESGKFTFGKEVWENSGFHFHVLSPGKIAAKL